MCGLVYSQRNCIPSYAGWNSVGEACAFDVNKWSNRTEELSSLFPPYIRYICMSPETMISDCHNSPISADNN